MMRFALGLCFVLASAAAAAQQPVVAFVDVNVVPMDSERIVAHQTVVTRDGRIFTMGPAATTAVPHEAQIVSGRGRYLMPGLVDMHAHFSRPALPGHEVMSNSATYQSDNVRFGLILVANGITTVRCMFGDTAILALARATASRRTLGPQIFTTGPITDGVPPMWPNTRAVATLAEGRRAVQDDKAAGFLAIKVYSKLSDSVYRAIIEEAAASHLEVVGHAPWSVGLLGAIAAKQHTIEHLDSFLEALQPPGSLDSVKWADMLKAADTTKLPDIARKVAASGSWIDPTIIVDQELPIDSNFAWEASLLPPGVLRRMKAGYPTSGEDTASVRRQIQLDIQIVRELHRAGARLLLGTDFSKPTVIAGFSLHDELQYFVDAGLSPYEALLAGTRSAAEAMEKQQEFGTVAPGMRADLLLLSANPLADVGSASKRVGVLLHGRWIPQKLLDGRLRKAASEAVTGR